MISEPQHLDYFSWAKAMLHFNLIEKHSVLFSNKNQVRSLISVICNYFNVACPNIKYDCTSLGQFNIENDQPCLHFQKIPLQSYIILHELAHYLECVKHPDEVLEQINSEKYSPDYHSPRFWSYLKLIAKKFSNE